MIEFIKNYQLDNMKKKFILLYFLNVTDIIFTLSLLRTGYFKEANILMVKVVENPWVSIIVKIILPAILLYYIYYQIKEEEPIQVKVANIAVTLSLFVYLIVNLSHLIWLSFLPIFLLG